MLLHLMCGGSQGHPTLVQLEQVSRATCGGARAGCAVHTPAWTLVCADLLWPIGLAQVQCLEPMTPAAVETAEC